MTTTGLRRDELAAFLRSRRARLRPAEVGLPDGVRRRTPGLRRQEVAQLAGMSVDYYVRLEQGRGPRPSRQVLSALARALLLSRDERAYLFRVAGESPPPTAGPSREVAPGLRHLIDAMTTTPAYLLDATYDVLAWNRLATWFVGDLSEVRATDRNMIRWMFRRSVTEGHWTDEDALRFARTSVADLRAAYGRYPGDRGIAELVTELLGTSPLFARLWAEHDVEERRPVVKRVAHPQLGPLEFECRVLHVPETDQRLIVYVPEPGSPTAAAFHRVAERLTAH
ncbi:helix-turn-helix transcriptional regulator [Micromonospora phytophila]|uniref:helix-turn-helix transcriptional regulator n=1 Tax=Micromonospora phytophila TaxID=709888 RepID=UPI0020304F52|nr:helix-turn-helix transcriptional regulator [Micromonospora phytophila]MCM0676618.1 helix-turn-helix transcriptional regulator [Micromonospora phytophila]